MKRSVPIRLGLVCCVASVTLGGPVLAEEGVAFKNLMGNIGILPKDKDPIPYRERAPLVLPPKDALPSPAASAAISDPQWPNDPDVAARRRRAAEERSPVTWSESRRAQDNKERLTPAELRAGRVKSSEMAAPRDAYGDARSGAPLPPSELYAKRKTDDEDVKVGVEPTRSALTDPPGGYRKPKNPNVQSAQGPKVDQQRLDANPMNWLTRRFSGANDEDE